jgi:hypothetical protein
MKLLRDLIVPEWGRALTGNELSVTHKLHQDILANIAKLEASALRVYSSEYTLGRYDWGAKIESDDTHTGLLICVEEIDRKVSREEIKSLLSEVMPDTRLGKLLKRILQYGVRGE